MRENRGLDTEMVLEHIEELVSQGVQGLAIAPNNSPEIRQCIDELYEQGIPVITLNSDAPGSRRLAFIGMDNYRRRTDRRRLASADAARGRQGASAGGTLE